METSLDINLAILAGEKGLETPTQNLLNWLKTAYGGNPMNVSVYATKEGVLGTLSIVYHRIEDRPGIRDGMPQYKNDAQVIFDKALEYGVVSKDLVLNSGFSVRLKCLQKDIASRILRSLDANDFKAMRAKIGNPDIGVIMIFGGYLRIFFDTNAMRDKYKQDQSFLKRCESVYADVLKIKDPEGYVEENPGISFESEDELQNGCGGNLWHFFK